LLERKILLEDDGRTIRNTQKKALARLGHTDIAQTA